MALQREERRKTIVSPQSRLSAFWSSGDDPQSDTVAEEKAKKKKSGLIKWWRAVTKSNKPDALRNQGATDDNMPLAPPPPLSYLVNRGSAEAPSVSGRHSSSPSVPTASSPKFSQTIAASSPTGQSPPSSRGDAENADGRTLNGYDDSDRRTERTEKTDDASGKRPSVYSAASEPNLRQTASNHESAPPVPPLPDTTRRIVREKSLPPLPPNETPALPTNADRPLTMFAYDSRGLPPGTRPPHDFLPPNAPFRGSDNRRQSFGGSASRPELMSQTMPVARDGYSIRQSFAPQYDEFGRSRGSFNPVDHLDDDRLGAASPQPSTTTKRKSKFGFASLLSKKNTREPENSLSSHGGQQPFPSMGRQDETMSGNVRMSIASRKPLESLVAQDPDFVAYRYPSGDQRLDLLK